MANEEEVLRVKIESKASLVAALESRMEFTKKVIEGFRVDDKINLGPQQLLELILQMSLNQLTVMTAVQTMLAEGLDCEKV